MFNKLLYGTVSSRGKEAVRRLSHRLLSEPLASPFLQTRTVVVRPKHGHILRNEFPLTKSAFNTDFITNTRGLSTHSSADQDGEGWLAWLGRKKKVIALVTISLLALGQFTSRELDSSSVVKVGDPRLHEPVREVNPGEIGSEHIQKVIDDLVKVMMKQNTISLSAPQIGVPLQIMVLDLFEFIRAGHIFGGILLPKMKKEESSIMVIVNPKLKQKSSKTGLPLESCVSDPAYAAAVERFLGVEVTGLNQHGQPFTVSGSGRHARVLQQEFDHLQGYVDKMDN